MRISNPLQTEEGEAFPCPRGAEQSFVELKCKRPPGRTGFKEEGSLTFPFKLRCRRGLRRTPSGRAFPKVFPFHANGLR